MDVNKRIKALREAKRMSQEELAHRVGYAGRSAIAKVESGKNDIGQSMLVKYANALGVSIEFLLFGKEPSQLPKNMERVHNIRVRPLLGTIACGDPILAEENIDTYIPVPNDIRCDFLLRCKGNSMIDANIYNGDLVYIRKQDIVDNGDIAAVLVSEIETEATLKRVYIYDDKVILSPCNATMTPIIYAGEEALKIRILGKAVAVTHKIA